MISTDQYFIDESENGMGSCLVLKDSWSDNFKYVIEKENISVLRLSQSAGWNDDDISFIEKIPNLRGIEIYSWRVKDITSLSAIKDLEYLGLQCEFTSSPNFSIFKKLQQCKLLWRSKAKTIFSCAGLSALNIVNYPSADLMDIQKLSNLTRLHLTSRKLVSLSGVENLKSLSFLDLANCSKLENLSGIEMCHMLQAVEITNCKKFHDVTLLGELKNLKNLTLTDCGKINSLSCLARCHSLENIMFVGDTTVEDGNLTSLLEIPALKTMWFANKRHYSHTREQVSEILS